AATTILSWEPARDPPTGPSGLDWAGLVGRVEALIGRAEQGPYLGGTVRVWLLSLANLLMPEVIGDHPSLTRPFFESAPLKGVWESEVEDIRLYRTQLLLRIGEHGLRDLALRFADTAPRGYAKFKVKGLSRSWGTGSGRSTAAPPPGAAPS